MKIYIGIMLVVLMGVLPGCKKSNTPKDYTVFIKDKTWWGMITNPGMAEEYYCIHFNADNTLLWSQFADDYPGQWVINDKRLTMAFATLGVQISADITDDNKLSNIIASNAAKIGSCQVIEKTDIVIDNTIWKGTLRLGINAYPCQMNFMTGFSVQLTIASTAYAPVIYTRSVFGAVIRFPFLGASKQFGIITSGTEMKGSVDSHADLWQTNKQ
jgi:hypothetical protein